MDQLLHLCVAPVGMLSLLDGIQKELVSYHITPHSSLEVCFVQLPELSCRALQLLEIPDLSTWRQPVYLTLLLLQIGIFPIKKPAGVSGHQALLCCAAEMTIPVSHR